MPKKSRNIMDYSKVPAKSNAAHRTLSKLKQIDRANHLVRDNPMKKMNYLVKKALKAVQNPQTPDIKAIQDLNVSTSAQKSNGNINQIQINNIINITAVNILTEMKNTLDEIEVIDIKGSHTCFNNGLSYHEATRQYQLSMIKEALKHTGGNKLEAARMLKISHSSIHNALKEIIN